MRGTYIDLTGQRFGSWVVMERAPIRKTKEQARWTCLCDCGSEKIVRGSALRLGISQSCGCQRQENRKKNWKGSGLTRTRIGTIYYHMLRRCNDPRCKSFYVYGKQGINVCKEWHSLRIFYDWAVNNGYKEDLTLERKDNTKGYTPENCTWIPKGEQSKNRRSNHWITFKGETKTVTEWASVLQISRNTLRYRIKHWADDIKALSTPIAKRNG